ncbi:unnamed protein product [Amoebophrya sp. A120]|nr:unnamed protein product [Amoebophrya sp. A120]|eukprot:GSA120T00025424001.1
MQDCDSFSYERDTFTLHRDRSSRMPRPTDNDNSGEAPRSRKTVVPKRFGLKYDPPQVVLEYLDPSSGKLFHRVMGLSKLKPDTDPVKVALKLKEKNEEYLSDDKVAIEQLVSLITKLQAKRKQQQQPHAATEDATTAESTLNLGRTRSESSSVMPISEDPAIVPPLTSSNLKALNDKSKERTKEFLNDLPPLEQLDHAHLSSSSFDRDNRDAQRTTGAGTTSNRQISGGQLRGTSNAVPSGSSAPRPNAGGTARSPEHQQRAVSSAKQQMSPGSSPSNAVTTNPRSPTARDRTISQQLNEIEGQQQGQQSGHSRTRSAGSHPVPPSPTGSKDSKNIGLDGYDYDHFDLNKLTKEEVQKHKDAMTKHFEANQIKPGDPRYVYDLRKDFRESPQLVNDWDSEESIDLPRM